MSAARVVRAGSLAALVLAWSRPAHAVDVTKGDDPVRLDVTETSVVAQHFGARGGESALDQGYGAWLNRLNAALSWRRLTMGARLDSSLYWLRPVDRDLDPALAPRALADENSRGCGSSPSGTKVSELDHLTLLRRALGAGSGSGILPSS